MSGLYKKHGYSNTPTHIVWMKMRSRCHSERDQAYKKYGGAGIFVCERWNDSFLEFLQDMGERPSKAHTLDRIDNSKGYYKDNCRWATWKQQQNNRSNNRRITYQGETRTLSEWADKTGISYSCLKSRISTGVPIELALTEKGPLINKDYKCSPKVRIYKGASFNTNSLAKYIGASRSWVEAAYNRFGPGDAFDTAAEQYKKCVRHPVKNINISGITKTYDEWAVWFGIGRSMIERYVRRGYRIGDIYKKLGVALTC